MRDRLTCDFPGCFRDSTWKRQWPNGERAFTCDAHAAGLGHDEEAPARRIAPSLTERDLGEYLGGRDPRKS